VYREQLVVQVIINAGYSDLPVHDIRPHN